jgi:hypothetical protein
MSPPGRSITSHSSGPSQSAARVFALFIAEDFGLSGSLTPSALDKGAMASGRARNEMRVAASAGVTVTALLATERPASAKARIGRAADGWMSRT